jgi:hypothetical protein
VEAPSTFCSSSTATTSGLTGVLCEDFESIVECKATYTSNCRAGWTGAVFGTPNYDVNHYHIRVQTAGGTAVISTATVSLNTLHHLWIKTIVGTGTNATTQVQFTTTGTRPGEWADCATNNACVQSTNGVSTGTPDSIAVFSNYTSATNCVDTYIDDIFVSATEIGNNP